MIKFAIISVLFFIIGYWSGSRDFKEEVKEKKEIIRDKIKKRSKIKPGVIPFKTPEDLEDERSGDKALEKEWRSSGKADVIEFYENK